MVNYQLVRIGTDAVLDFGILNTATSRIVGSAHLMENYQLVRTNGDTDFEFGILNTVTSRILPVRLPESEVQALVDFANGR